MASWMPYFAAHRICQKKTPSSNQRWLVGKSALYSLMFPATILHFFRGFSQLATFDETGGFLCALRSLGAANGEESIYWESKLPENNCVYTRCIMYIIYCTCIYIYIIAHIYIYIYYNLCDIWYIYIYIYLYVYNLCDIYIYVYIYIYNLCDYIYICIYIYI